MKGHCGKANTVSWPPRLVYFFRPGIAADRAETGVRIGETSRKADAGPAADARENGDVLLAVVLVGDHVADDAGRSLELVELLAVVGSTAFR